MGKRLRRQEYHRVRQMKIETEHTETELTLEQSLTGDCAPSNRRSLFIFRSAIWWRGIVLCW
jgi:hypothetical protein